MNPKRVGFLVYPAMQALDLAGPMDAFAAAAMEEGEGRVARCYENVTIGLDAKVIAAESGLCIKPQFTLRNAPRLDTLLIPGGAGMRDPKVSAKVAAWISGRARQLRRIAAVCTGVYGLAASGLLDGRRVSTHWRFAQDLAQRFPALKVDARQLFVKDGAFYTSAGITAGIDLSLALIEEDYGPSVALSVARELVVYLKRPGGQAQYSEPLQFQTQSADRMADIASWIVANLRKDLSIELLAARARLCPRQFTRRFKRAFGTTPAAFIESARVDEARRRLAGYHGTIIDFCGPWEVFNNVMVGGRMGAFDLYTVSETANPITTSGGMKIVPNHTIGNAPAPKIIVIPAQGNKSDAVLEWVRKSSKTADVTMSVCTGAYLLAATGLMSGKAMTTHHASYVDLANQFPDVHIERGARFVEDGSLASAGGLSSGIDLALRVVERYYGRDAATQTAYDMEYQGLGWTDPDSNSIYAKIRTSANGHPLCAVCSMAVDAAGAPKSVYKSTTYYFCSPAHKDLFDATPEKFVALLDKA